MPLVCAYTHTYRNAKYFVRFPLKVRLNEAKTRSWKCNNRWYGKTTQIVGERNDSCGRNPGKEKSSLNAARNFNSTRQRKCTASAVWKQFSPIWFLRFGDPFFTPTFKAVQPLKAELTIGTRRKKIVSCKNQIFQCALHMHHAASTDSK